MQADTGGSLASQASSAPAPGSFSKRRDTDSKNKAEDKRET